MNLIQEGTNNKVSVGENITVTGRVKGNNNNITLSGSTWSSSIQINITGDNNVVEIGTLFAAKSLHIVCGSHVPAHNVSLHIGNNFSIERNGRFLLYTSGNRLTIGNNCMFSQNITIRCGECPHLIFDFETGEYLDQSDGVFVGDHVWVGENAYITKAASIGDECVIGACSVVTRRFDVKNAAIAGNPAKVVREGVQWIRNRGMLETGSKYKMAFDAYHSQYPV